MKYYISLILLLFSLILTSTISAAAVRDPIIINATITTTDIQLSPNTIPENTPFIVHVTNKAGFPVELENTDTSVEVYAGMDRTFKVGLTKGNYVFFNDFDAHTQGATLFVTASKPLVAEPATNHAMPQVAAANSHFSEILFIIWRESVEALLVVGIVYSWLKQVKTDRQSGLLFLWLGVGLGGLCAVLLSFLLVTVSNVLPPDAAHYFQAAMALIAAVMIIYMVKWMRYHGRALKSNMQNSLGKNPSIKWRNISILTVVAVAFAREASEAAIFIYALGFENSGVPATQMAGILVFGIALAVATIYILQLGNKFFSWRFFFKVTEVLLLLLGGGLLLQSVDLLISAGFLPVLIAKVWDTSFLIGNGGFFAPLVSSFTGYRPTPSLMDVIIYAAYWTFIYWLLQSRKNDLHAKNTN